MEDAVGRVVYSIAGRDQGKLFVVVGMIGNQYYLLANGKQRKLDKAKKKKVKHVKMTDICLEDIRTKLEKHDKITNAELRKAMKNIDIVDVR